MSDFILIFIGIFVLILIILIFTLLAYVYNTYVSYTIEINKNLNDSEETINKTNDAFNKLQDTVVDNIATVKTNQDKILENNKDYLNTLDSNLIKIMTIKNDNSNINSIISSNLNDKKTIDINFNSMITSYKSINALTTPTQYFNICNDESEPDKRKCINMNIDKDGLFNIYTKNNLATDAKSNIADISIRDNNNNILASFKGDTNSISLGSNINPAIFIKNNIYTPDIIVCNYMLINAIDAIPASETSVAILAQPAKISISIISNFKISKDVFINLYLFEDMITSLVEANIDSLTSKSYSSDIKLLKIKSKTDIDKNTITVFIIPIIKKSGYFKSELIPYSTNGYITSD